MWCISRPPRRHCRQVIDEVATAPATRRTAWVEAWPEGSGSSATRIGHPSQGGCPSTAMSPPRLTRTPPSCRFADMAARTARSDPRPLAVAPRSSRTPLGSRSTGPSSVTDRQPGTRVEGAAVPAVVGLDRGEVTVVAERDQGLAHGGIGHPAGPPGGGQGHAHRLGQPVAQHEQAAVLAVDPGDLRVLPEPARLPVQRRHDGVHGLERPAEVGPVATRRRGPSYPGRRVRRRRRWSSPVSTGRHGAVSVSSVIAVAPSVVVEGGRRRLVDVGDHGLPVDHLHGLVRRDAGRAGRGDGAGDHRSVPGLGDLRRPHAARCSRPRRRRRGPPRGAGGRRGSRRWRRSRRSARRRSSATSGAPDGSFRRPSRAGRSEPAGVGSGSGTQAPTGRSADPGCVTRAS